MGRSVAIHGTFDSHTGVPPTQTYRTRPHTYRTRTTTMPTIILSVPLHHRLLASPARRSWINFLEHARRRANHVMRALNVPPYAGHKYYSRRLEPPDAWHSNIHTGPRSHGTDGAYRRPSPRPRPQLSSRWSSAPTALFSRQPSRPSPQPARHHPASGRDRRSLERGSVVVTHGWAATCCAASTLLYLAALRRRRRCRRRWSHPHGRRRPLLYFCRLSLAARRRHLM